MLSPTSCYQTDEWDTGFAAKKLTGSTTRTFADKMALGIAGKPSIKEREEKDLIRQVRNLETTHREGIKKLTEMAVDSLSNSNTAELDDLYNRAYDSYGIESEEFAKMIFEKRLERILPAVDKILQGQDNTLLADKISEYIYKFNKGRSK
jgi:hypothetical protein